MAESNMTRPIVTDQKTAQKTIMVDLDGTLHKYSRGWQNGELYDEPNPDVEYMLKTLVENGFRVIIFCARLNELEVPDVEVQKKMITEWLDKYGIRQGTHYAFMTCKKMGALAYVDDKAVRWTNALDILKRFI